MKKGKTQNKSVRESRVADALRIIMGQAHLSPPFGYENWLKGVLMDFYGEAFLDGVKDVLLRR